VSILVHKETGYFFRFEKYRSKYSPAHQLRTSIQQWERLTDRDDHLRDWLWNLRTEVAALDSVSAQVDNNPEELPRNDVEFAASIAVPQPVLVQESRNPRAFISYGGEDRAFVQKFAADLRGYGVDVWYDKWEIKTGDPIPAKIDEGLEGCEFFIIVLSRTSVHRPWVKMELGAATGRVAGGRIRKIIPAKIDDCSDLPSTISSLCWEDFSSQPYESALKRVLDSIFDVDVRPPLGLPPTELPSLSSFGLKGDTTE
jgi:hypothetical protein